MESDLSLSSTLSGGRCSAVPAADHAKTWLAAQALGKPRGPLLNVSPDRVCDRPTLERARTHASGSQQELAAAANARVFALHVADRFADHGLVGAAVIEDGEITGLVMSCRVLGMGIEHAFVQHVTKASGAGQVTATIVPTARNIPVRNIYRDNGFVLEDGHVWRWKSAQDLSGRGSDSSFVLVSDVSS